MILCFDIGGSRIKAGHSSAGIVTAMGEVATPLTDLAQFGAALRQFVRPGQRGVAISVTGVVDGVTGRAKVANIPCLDGVLVAQELAAMLGLPVVVRNDADCFAMAEMAQGAARGHENVFAIILGSGVGGGLIVGGRLVAGTGGFSGEWGHGPVIRDPSFACGCGQTGCLDTVGSARGLERLHKHLTGETAVSETILRLWQAGQPMPAVDLWLDLVSGVLAMVVNLVGASVVPVGGGLGNVPALIAALDHAVRARILRRTDAPLVVPAQISVDAGLIGAAAVGEQTYG